MRNYVIINGINSLTIQGLAINNLPPITKPMIRTQREEIDGRDGDIVTELGYSAYDKQMEIGLYGNFDIDSIIKYFTGEGTIVFSNEADKYYNFKILDQIDYEKLLKFKTAVVTFHCQPFKYPLEEEPEEAEIKTITGTGESITLENVEEAPMKIVYKGNTYQNGEPTPDTPIPIQVVSGDNSIEVVGYNKLKYPYRDTTKTTNGITFTDLGDGSIKVNGTATANAYFYLTALNDNYYKNMHGQTLRLIGCPSGGSNSTYRLIFCTDNWAGGIDTGNGSNFVVQDTYYNQAFIQVYNGATINNLIFKPMLTTDTSATMNDYKPYTGASYPINLPVENLLSITNGTYENNGVTAVVSNGEITLNGTASGTSFIVLPTTNAYELKVGEKYTISINNSVANSGGCIRIDNNGTYDTYFTTENRTNTITINTTWTPYNDRITLRTTSGTSYSNYKIKPQFEKGTKANHYTPYGTTPIELCKIGTYQDKIDKSTGKNLFDPSDYEECYCYLNQVKTANANWGIFYLPCIANQKYTISGLKSQYSGTDIMQLDSNKNIVSRLLYRNSTTEATLTATQDGYIGISFVWNSGATYGSELGTIMLNQGSTALPYEPYGTSWYLKKEIGKVVLNGTENWELGASGDYIFYRLNNINWGWVRKDSLPQYGLCTHFTNASISSSNTNIGFYMSGDTQIRFREAQMQTIPNWKTWLSNNNVSVYFALATPTYTLIEGELLNQLEAIKMSYEGQTNLSQTNNDMPFELDASVTFLTPMEINNIGNIYAKPILTIEGTGNIGVVLNGIQILEIDLSNNGKITIDVPKLEAYNPDDDSLLNRLVTGDYMKLLINEGDNKITFTGEVSGATLTNYIRWI